MAESRGSLIAKSVQKHAGRAKEKILQNLGKVDRTADEIFDEHLQNFQRQQNAANRLQKEFNNYIRCIRAVQTASKSFLDAVGEIYESQWGGHDLVFIHTQSVDMLYQDFSHKMGDQVLIPLNTYQSQFPEMRKKIDKRGRKLVDYDGQRHNFQALQMSMAKKRDDVKLTRGRELLDEAKRTYEVLNSELHDELPALHDSRILFLVTNLQTLFNAEHAFHSETAKVYNELEAIVDKLATDSQRGSYSIKKTNGSNSLPRKITNDHSLVLHNTSSPNSKNNTTTSPGSNDSNSSSNNVLLANNDSGVILAGVNVTTTTTSSSGHGDVSPPSSLSSPPSSPPLTTTTTKTTDSHHHGNDDNNADDDEDENNDHQLHNNNNNHYYNQHLNHHRDSNIVVVAPTTATTVENNNTTTTTKTSVDNNSTTTSGDGKNSSGGGVGGDSNPTSPPPAIPTVAVATVVAPVKKNSASSKELLVDNNTTTSSDVVTEADGATSKGGGKLQELYDIPVEASTENLPSGVLYRVKSTYKYNREDVDELSFDIGELIQVVGYDDPEEQEEGWLMGIKESNGEKGMFPANFTKPL